MVDFPDAESPVNQIVKPRCLRRVVRSARVREGCQVIFLRGVSIIYLWLILLAIGIQGNDIIRRLSAKRENIRRHFGRFV